MEKEVFIISSLKKYFRKNPIVVMGIVIFVIYELYSSFYEGGRMTYDNAVNEVPSYTITKQYCKKPHKCVYEILLDDILSRQDVEKIAEHLRGEVSGVERLLIGYRLKCFSLAKGYTQYWARSDFNPSLEITFLNSLNKSYTSCGDFESFAKKWNEDN